MLVSIRLAVPLALIFLMSSFAGAAEVVIPFTSSEAEIIDAGDGRAMLVAPSFSSFSSPGDPALPYLDTYVLLTPYADVRTVRVQIRNAVEEVLPERMNVAPVPPALSCVDGRIIENWGHGKQIIDGRNILVYEQDSFYPFNYATIGCESRLGPYLLMPLRFWPYRYNPVTGEITHLVNGEVAIVFDSTPTPPSLVAATPGLSNRLTLLASNWHQAADWYPQQVAAAPLTSTPLAIITTSSIVQNSTKLAAYVAHKANMGFSVTVATEANWGGGTGNTAAENIRAWLQANYLTKAHYAVLIGNPHPSTGNVPMKMLWPNHGAEDYEDGPSDYYYADLTGNWDLDGDGYYGEGNGDFGPGGIDLVPEVIIGRIPYYGVMTDLDKILQKIINYESASSVGSWAQRMLTPFEPLDSGTPLWQLGEVLRANVAKPRQLGYYRIYEQDYGVMPPPEKTPCNESNVRNEWQKGYAFVFWGTHGWDRGAADIFTTESCAYLDDTKPAFTFQGSCDNGHPETVDNLGYALLRNGAIGTVSASRVSWYYPGETTYDNSDSDPGMTYAYAKCLARDRMRCGDAFYDVVSRPPDIWANHVVFNLYGDPTVAPQWPTTSIAIETTSLPIGKVGETYRADIIASGGQLPYIFSLQSGSLPPGLAMSSAGIIMGTPQRSGVYSFTVQVSEYGGGISTKNLFIETRLQAHYNGLDSDPDWNCEGAWAYGAPAGGGSHDKDPTSGHTGSRVYGYNLNGDYTNSMPARYLTTTAFDCSSLTNTKLVFWRWLGVDRSTYDRANISVSTNGTSWTTMWSNPTSAISDTEWNKQIIDISSIANGQPYVYIRWGMGPTNSYTTYPGWNIDDIEFEGTLTKPFIRHTPYPDTDVTTGFYYINTEILSSAVLSAGNAVLHWKTSGGFTDVVMSHVSGNTYRGAIPAQPSGTTVAYYITAADDGGTAVSPTGAPTQCCQFNVVTDLSPPVIIHTPLPNTRSISGPYRVYATVTDNLGIHSVTLSYSKNGGTTTTVYMSKTNNPADPNEYTATIPGPAAAGSWINYKITATDSSQGMLQCTSPSFGWHMFSILPGVTRIYNFPMDNNPGWSCDSGWEFGVPTGGGTNGKDPTSGVTGSYVYGYNLNGNYTNNLPARYLTTPALDCSNLTNVVLKYYRWLGVEGNSSDKATLEVSSGGDWHIIWQNPTNSFCDTYWYPESQDISFIADTQSAVYVRWGMGPTNSSNTYPGWNIDQVEVWGCLYNPVASLLNLKQMQDGAMVTVRDHIISAAYTDYFYIQQPGVYYGLRVAWPGSVNEGAPVTVRGLLRTRNGEREIVAETVTEGTIGDPVPPIAMTLRSLGGVNFGAPPLGQKGVPGAVGPNNIGALVRVAGRVTQTSADYFYIDDGSGIADGTLTGTTPNAGVRVSWPGAAVSTGQFVTITGVSSGFANGSQFLRCVLPRRTEDIGFLP